MKHCSKNLTHVKKLCFLSVVTLTLLFMFACTDSNIDGWENKPYDPSQPITISKFYPDSGGMATNVLIEGSNFGTDPTQIKVYYNNKRAAVVKTKGNMLYVITPRQPGDTCNISVVMGKDSLTFDKTFEYTTTVTLTTLCGDRSRPETVNGTLVNAAFKAPRYVAVDAEKNIFVSEWTANILRRINEKDDQVVTVLTKNRINALSCDAKGQILFGAPDKGLVFFEFDPERLWQAKQFNIVQAEDSKYFKMEWKHSVTACTIDSMMYTRSYDGEVVKFHPKTKKAWLVKQLEDKASKADGYCMFSPLEPEWMYIAYTEKGYIGRYNVLTEAHEEYAGAFGQKGHQDGERKDAAFGTLRQMVFDKDGNLFVADQGNHCIRKISADGIVTTVVGIPGKAGFKDGTPEVALLDNPYGVAVDSEGTIYVVEEKNNTVRKLTIQ